MRARLFVVAPPIFGVIIPNNYLNEQTIHDLIIVIERTSNSLSVCTRSVKSQSSPLCSPEVSSARLPKAVPRSFSAFRLVLLSVTAAHFSLKSRCSSLLSSPLSAERETEREKNDEDDNNRNRSVPSR